MSFFDLPPIIERMLLVSDKISDLNFSVGQLPQVHEAQSGIAARLELDINTAEGTTIEGYAAYGGLLEDLVELGRNVAAQGTRS